jgi:hypothetical protein
MLRFIPAIVLGLTTLNLAGDGYAQTPPVAQLIEQLRTLCASPDRKGEYIKEEVKGEGNVSVRLFKVLGLAGIKGEASFSKEEWDGVRKVLQKDQVDENRRYRDCVEKLTPLFLEKFYPPPKTSARGVKVELVGNTLEVRKSRNGRISNVDHQVLTIIQVELKRGNRSLLPGGVFTLAADTPVSSYTFTPEHDRLFAFDTAYARAILTEAKQKVVDQLDLKPESADLLYQICARLEFDDDQGGHFREYMVLWTLTRNSIQDDLTRDKNRFDQCQARYKQAANYPDYFLSSWSGDTTQLAARLAQLTR